MKLWRCAAAFGVAMLPLAAAAYSPVTDARLTNPEPENWLLIRGNYQGWMYSPLDQINSNNVKHLTPVWAYSTGVDSGHEAPPIINDGMMFVATPYDQVIALDAKTGNKIWEYKRELPEGFGALHNTKRGIALYGDKVLMAAQDDVVLALDAKTGAVAWESDPIADWHEGYYMTLAPLVVKGKVMVGGSGGEFGIRGFVQAVDAESGKRAWKTYTIPGPGDPGGDTWRATPGRRGGGSVWMTGTYDPDSDIAYLGRRQRRALVGEQRPGDNLYTSSTLAMDPDDRQDREPLPVPLERLVGLGRDERPDGRSTTSTTGRRSKVWSSRRVTATCTGSSTAATARSATSRSNPYVNQTVFKSVDPKTGRPTYNDEHKPGTGKYVDFCPSLWGGKDWPYEAYNPNTQMVYIPANDNHCGHLEGKVAG